MRHQPLVAVLMAAAVGVAVATSPVAKHGASGPALPSDTATVHIGAAGAGTGAFVAWPPGRGPAPAVIVIQEWWGLNDQIRETARRFAKQGFVALAPDLYHGQVATTPEEAHELMRGLETGDAVADLRSAVAWLRSQPRSAKGRIGVVGFCMGGGYSLDLALNSPEISAAVMFYGRPETDPQKLASLTAPLQGHFGADDKGITVERVEEFKSALKTAGKNAEIFVYPGAGHAFMHEGRDSYRPEAAKTAWGRTVAFFKKYLKSAS